MLLVDVRIKNYKCILDSETFTVDQMTCLVGKNESGNSAILQALYILNPVDKEDIYDALMSILKCINPILKLEKFRMVTQCLYLTGSLPKMKLLRLMLFWEVDLLQSQPS